MSVVPRCFRKPHWLWVTVQTIEKDTGKDLSGDVEQRDAPVGITELPVPLPLAEMEDGRVFEILRNLSLEPHLLEECYNFCHQPGPTAFVDRRWDCDESRCFTTGNQLHAPDDFL
ncbi:unnamed protein product [Schistocephalus solidus]|uniref:Rab3 GTPase-activating protein catalytic subunit n=1 Tax=Schistocephalus solidus TaxID=70667 RepID=A0A183TMT9_SCHSO|nr:unnamed protein product [Schistocephalus solidus]